MWAKIKFVAAYLLGPEPSDAPGHLWPRWLFLRCLGLIFLSAFYSWIRQVQGLIGPEGILPAQEFLSYLKTHAGALRYWIAPTVLWFGSGRIALNILCWTGLAASVFLTLNFAPQIMTAICTVAYLSLICVARDFASYQSDGMLLEAGLISLFFAPSGWRPGLGSRDPPSPASTFLLLWIWFRIYFESGLAKMLSGDPHWRHFTAMDDYYQNGPLPTWIGWYVQQLPHRFHAGTTLLTLAVELGVVLMLFLPRPFRIVCFWILLPFQVGIILTANYAFINYISIALSVLLLDDKFLSRWPRHPSPLFPLPYGRGEGSQSRLRLWISGIVLGWQFYASAALLLFMLVPNLPLPAAPITALEPFRFASRYGLFAVMTPARFEIEFEGSDDGKNWKVYPFQYKPQTLDEAPRIYAPYQPRFDWNLWFCSLGSWRNYLWVVRTEELLLENNPAVLSLFKGNPFPGKPPRQVHAVFWQYWFTDLPTKRREGLWWRRQRLGLYAPALERRADKTYGVIAMPQ